MYIADLPSKFHNLVLLENDVSVPACLCLGTAELSCLYDNFIEIVDAAGRVLDRINRTSATFLGEDLAEIQDIIGALSPSQTAEPKLLDLFRPCFGTDCMDEAFAVRSANTIEDRSSKSFAGLYDTFLDMRGSSELLRAIRAVWMSAYSRAVITERIHAGLLNDSNPMSVIIQRMVPAAYAGVAFSRHPVTGDDTILVEIVDGRGDSLVSGRNAGDHYAIGRRDPDAAATARDSQHQPILEAVTSILLHVERRMGPVDIEWAWDGQTAWLLQARPITSLDRAESRDEPIFLVTDLYGDDTQALEQMRPLPDFISYFREKRTRIADFARRHNLGSATALVLRLNGKALELPAFRTDVLDAFSSEEIILDFSSSFRQIILPREKLVCELEMLLSDRTRLHTIVVRDFIRGDAGIITHLARTEDAPVTVVGEWSADGLLAINRGTAATRVIRLAGLVDEDAGLPWETTRQLYQATIAAHDEVGPVQIEWVKDGSTIYPLDFSALSEESMFAEPGDGTVISRGYAFAPTLVLDDDRDLELLSIAPSISLTNIPEASEMGPSFDRLLARIGSYRTAPIVVSNRPLAALAPLLPLVSGFIFERAAVLSHLSILIREKGIPAVQSPEIYAYARGKTSLLIDIGEDISISSPDDTAGTTVLPRKTS
jgi:rifampicin phosphotransferase